MLYFGQVVIGPAGSGKSTYCQTLQENNNVFRRNFIVVNLDPAAEIFRYRCDIDIRDLITLDDVMDEMELGPNGGLVYCLEYLIENIEWLQEQLSDLGQDDYVLFDCPGQLELYVHLDVMQKLTKMLQSLGFSICSVCLIDCTFMTDMSKFIGGLLMSLSCMTSLGLPHINILSKCDIAGDRKLIKKYIKSSQNMEDDNIDYEIDKNLKFSKKYKDLTKSIRNLLGEYGIGSMFPLDKREIDDIRTIIYHADNCIQYGENLEPNERDYEKADDYLMGYAEEQ